MPAKCYSYLLACLSGALMILCSGCKEKEQPLFHEMSEAETGIGFNNKLDLDGDLSVLEFEYMYNGAGVAIADFDLDGLQDVYFTGNMVSSRLYRNLGEWKFEDLTETAGVGTTDWVNGVAVVDINQDSYPDIYLSKGGPRGSSKQERSNLLFINKGLKDGQLFFEEEAAAWGLDDPGYSVQAAFFDYDLDGDLDMYLLSNALVDFNRNTSRPIDRSGKAPSVDKLYRNNGDHTFTDISVEAGILTEGFGLGVEINDINEDGLPDVYVSNDFLTDDIAYINQGDGTFKNKTAQYFKHLTFNGMGHDIGDINNDGLMDIVVLDMLPEDNERWKLTMMGNNYDEFQTGLSYGYQPQYIRNTLQLNNGNGTYSEIGQLAGISATEWSWSALLADFDQDGLKDLAVTNGYRQDITNLDFMVYGNRVLTMGTEEANRKQRLEALNALPGIKINNYFFSNKGNLIFEDNSEKAGFSKPTYSNGMAYGDLDNDGDLDLVINNIDDPAGVYKNTTNGEANRYLRVDLHGPEQNLNGLGSEISIYVQGQVQKQYVSPFRGYLSTVANGVHFGLGEHRRIDSLLIRWPDGKREVMEGIETNQHLSLDYKDAMYGEEFEDKPSEPIFTTAESTGLDFIHEEDGFVDFKIQPLLPHMHSRNGPGIGVGDLDGDGLDDVYIGGATGQSGRIFLQQQDKGFRSQILEGEDSEDMGALFFDADKDGDQDLYIVSGGTSFPEGAVEYRDRLYKNQDGKLILSGGLPESAVSGSVVSSADYNRDGLPDLFVGGRVRPGAYPMPPESQLLKNRSTSSQMRFEKENGPVAEELNSLGMVTAALWTDYNNDNWPDLLVVGEFMSIHLFENRKGNLVNISEDTGFSQTHGWWNSISAGDFDKDGDMDYLIGNFGLNGRFQASAEEPVCIYAADYDKNGLLDPVICHYVDGVNQLAHSRNDLIEQINAMRVRFRSYSDYAKTSFSDSFTKSELEEAYVVKCETFESSYLENLGNGRFEIRPLPRNLQIAPVFGTQVGDFDGDSLLDIMAVGNFYSNEVFSGRYDASIGWILKGDGTGNFKVLESADSGFMVEGDAKSLALLSTAGEQWAVASLNDGPLKVHRRLDNSTYNYRLEDDIITAWITHQDGKTEKREYYQGSGYLSQSSRILEIPVDARSVKLVNDKMETRQLDLLW